MKRMDHRWMYLALYSAICVAAGMLFTACFAPQYPEGINCSNAGSCPSGMACGADNRCWLPGRECTVAGDCASGVCDTSTGMCAAPGCNDGVHNGGETDIDCGGDCAGCGDGLGCTGPDDCQSQVCEGGMCAVPRCGDGVVNQAVEVCDDGGPSATCNATCMLATCGDNVVDIGEECDAGGETAECDADCTSVACGDGVANAAAGEACDSGGESAECDADCSAVMCGDGVTNTTAGEACDDAGNSATCDANCTTAACGDSFVNSTAGEDCDAGGETAECDADCTSAVCGDGYINTLAGETCDGDGGGTGGETAVCDVDCTAAMCGDRVTNATAGEQCDDGNAIPDDGCDQCILDSGCSSLATWSYQMAPDLWLCAYNNLTGKTWPQTYGVCNEAGGFYLASVAPMTRRGLPTDAQISAALTAAAVNGHDYITTGHPARSCSWDSVATPYEICNGLGYIRIASDMSGTGSNWQALTDGNDADFRLWPSANATGAHPLASLCMNANGDPSAYIFDHRWR